MKPILLIDFGSTYTKVTVVDADTETLLGTASSYTTVQTDINDGLNNALEILRQQTGNIEFVERYGCSSAAGGLKMISCGLVPELTAEAAKQASLGAGAKVIKVYAYQLTEDDIEEIETISPEIFLLTGGTDGGNKENILYNANALAGVKANFPIVIAGNRSCARECQRILEEAGKQVFVCPNVMPKFNELNIEPTKDKIREIFLDRIVKAKGLSKATELISGILMPTPAAMLKSMLLLSKGCEGEQGIGELIGVDVGGATTDIYSIADGMPTSMSTIFKGLPEPYSKRTVEGDIGMRYSVHGIVEATGIERVCKLSGLAEDRAIELIELVAKETDRLPNNEELEALDFALASLAIEVGVTRHAGILEKIYTPMGEAYMQVGKDLRGVEQIIVTGGSLIHTKETVKIANHALYNLNDPNALKPQKAHILVDRKYILAAMGLLSEKYPQLALRIMKKELEYHEFTK